MPVDIIENFRLGTNLPLDSRYSVNSYNDVSAYWHGGMQVYQEADNQLYWYNGTKWNPVIDTSSGEWKLYVDGSLGIRDVSISFNTNSINNIEASLGNFVLKTGDIISGSLTIQTDLSVNGNGSFGRLNVSGNSFPGSISTGDLFFRTDLNQMFLYDASRSKWLSIDRATYNAGVESALASTTTYMSVGDGDMSSINGFLMPKNGTILGATIHNRINVSQPKTMSIRVNDVSAYALTFSTGLGIVGTNGNVDFNKNDIIQLAVEQGGDTIRDVITSFEVAWRE